MKEPDDLRLFLRIFMDINKIGRLQVLDSVLGAADNGDPESVLVYNKLKEARDKIFQELS